MIADLQSITEQTARQASAPRISRRHVAGAVMGIALEVYDFTTYAYFAVAIGECFFPTSSSYKGLMLSLATFGSGFLTRPLGALVIGAYADRAGRRPAMILSFLMMGVAVLSMALIPSYAKIGIAAPLLVLIARLTQGFALGGELGATTALLLESAPAEKRGYYTSLQYVGQGAAAILAGAVGVSLSALLDGQALESYGWRIALALGAAILPIGLVIRSGIPETLRQDVQTDARPVGKQRNGATLKVLVLGLLIISSGAIGNYIFHYMTTFAKTALHMQSAVSLAVPAVTGACIMVFGVIGGAWSDRVGRRPVMIYPTVLCLAATCPVFYYILHRPSALSLWGGLALLSASGGLGAGAALTAVTEALPKSVRSTGLSLIYALAVAIFGGSSQIVVTWLIHVTGDPMALAWYIVLTGAVGLIARWKMPETAPRRLAGVASKD